MEIRRHSHTAQAAYHDLVSLLLDEAASDIHGTPTLREIKGKGYWYDRYRIGSDIKGSQCAFGLWCAWIRYDPLPAIVCRSIAQATIIGWKQVDKRPRRHHSNWV